MDRCGQSQLAEEWRVANELAQREQERADSLAAQIRMAEESRWLRLGRKLGVGPKFKLPE
jgi:hypothetical protein